MSRDIKLLHPELQKKAVQLIEACKKQKLNVIITETYRTVAEQEAVFNKGNSRARGTEYQSGHQWGVAFDFCENVKGKEYANKDLFKKVGAVGKSLGLFWGGDFKSFVDMPHFELPEFMPNNSTKTLKEKYSTPEKFIASWNTKVATATYPTMKQGSTGELVEVVQQLLNTKGSKLATDGIFGAKTTTSVKAYQKTKGLAVDGIVGKKTITQLTK